MKKMKPVSFRLLLAFSVIGFSTTFNLSHAAILSWSGGSPTTGNWSDSQNWGFVGTPATGDILIFPAAQPRLANTNDIAGLTLNQIRFVGAGGGYAIRGNAFTLTNGIPATNTAGLNTLFNNITLGGPAQLINVGSGASLTLAGTLDGAGGLTKIGPGTLTLSGGGGIENLFTGDTTLNEGILQLGNANVIRFGTLTIGDGWGGPASDIVRFTAAFPIFGGAGGSIVVIKSSGLLDLNGFSDDVGPIEMDGGRIETGAGLLTLFQPFTTYSTAGTNGSCTFNGKLQINSASTFFITNQLILNAVISGGASLTKTGPGDLSLSGINTYSGLTVLQQGRLRLQNGNALGSAASGTVVSNLASLVLDLPFGVTNESLTLNGFGISSAWGALDCEASGINYWTGPVTLNATSTIAPYNSGNVLRISGAISGPGGLIVATETGGGSGTLYFEGPNANTYAGTTLVNAGTLFLARGGGDGRAIPGPLVISSGTVRLGASWQIYSPTESVTMANSTLLDLNNFDEWIGPLDMTGAQITTGAGLLYIGNNVNVNASSVAMSTISGRVDLFSTIKTITCASGSFNPALQISANVSGTGIIKNGPGNLQLSGVNTYSDLTTINDGFILINTPTGLGTGAAGTVLNGGNLSLVGATVVAEPLTNNSANSILQAGGTSGWGTNVVLNADLRIQVLGGGVFDISGPISGTGNITKIITGTLRFSGAQANTYVGTTTVQDGTLELNKPASTPAVPGNLVINNGATARLANSQQTVDSADVLVNGGGLFDFATSSTYMDTLHGTGTVNFGVGGWIWIGRNNGSSTFDGQFTGVGLTGGWTVGTTGTGTFTMNGNNTFSAGNITIQGGGKTVINGAQPQAWVRILDTSTTLGGAGTVGIITAPGNIAPGSSPGILTSSNVAFTATGDYFVELNGPTPGTGYDQLNVRGTNNLAGATLHVTADFTTPVGVGSQFVILNNDGGDAITGTFGGLPQGSPITSGFYTFTIGYTGGSGNDVVLTLTNVPGAAVGSAVSSGNGDGAIGPNECNYLSIVISNKTGTAMTNVTATLASLTAGAAITQPFSMYPNIAGNNQGTNVAAFQISTTTNFVCGTNINLLLSVTTSTHGSFAVPLVMPTGQPAAVALRYNNNSVTNVPDIGTIESTNTVASWSGAPIAKVAVSLWLVAPFSADVTLTLIAPDGTPVLLSSGNGAGANFGTGSADGSRTTFDDAAASSITAGASPFVGTFRPQASLANLLAANPVGNWRLRIQDSFGSGSPDTLRAWSLFLYPVECAPGSGLCELCPDITIFSALDGSSLVASDRLSRNGLVSTCAAPTTCPGPFGGDSPFYDAYTFRNGPSNACITVTLNAAATADLFSAAYLGSFSPTDNCSNYLADAGNSTSFSSASSSYSFSVASGVVFVVEVNSVFGSTGSYQLTVSGGDCRPVLNLTSTGANQAVLDWTTAAAGYVLERTNNLAAGPVWQPVPGEPAVINSRFTVTNTIFPSNQFYRLRKPLP